MNVKTLIADILQREEAVLFIDASGVDAHGLKPKTRWIEKERLAVELSLRREDAHMPIHLFVDASRAPLDVEMTLHLMKEADVRLTEYHLGRDGHALTWTATSELAEGASLSTTALVDMDASALDMRRRSVLKTDATHQHALAVFTAEASRIETTVRLEGPNAKAGVSASVLAKKGDVLCKTTVEHAAPGTEGVIDHRGVAMQKGTLIFEGVGTIRAGMRGSVATQETKGIVLGEDARLDAYPLLYIDEHDVTASHGAAIGKIDENQLHYMMSRGLRREDAERLIIAGYFHAVQRALHNPELGDRLRDLLSASFTEVAA